MFFRLIVIVFLFFGANRGYSHPHLFIKSGVELIDDETGVTGLRIRWSWDSYWSQDVIQGCDVDRNGVLNDKEIKLVFTDFFDGIKEFNYFMELYVNGKNIPVRAVRDFHALIESDKTVTYLFTVPLAAGSSINSLKVGFNDETIYAAFDKNVEVKNGLRYSAGEMSSKILGYYGVSTSFILHKL